MKRAPVSLLAALLLLEGCSGDVATSESTRETPGSSTMDVDCDGTPESCHVYRLDAHGRYVFSADDADCDGQPDSTAGCTRWGYDEDGNIKTAEIDAECDGITDRCNSMRYDSHGTMVATGTDEDCDGKLDLDCTTLVGGVSLDRDDDCDGTPNVCTVVTRYENGGLKRIDDDSDCDGQVGPCANSWTYDEDGHETSNGVDADCDGVPKSCSTKTYDASGKVVATEYDDACDGTPDSCSETAYDAEGVERFRVDEGCDGVPEECTVTRYDETGAYIDDGSDSNCDGEADLDCSTLVVDGNTETTKLDNDCDGTPETCRVRTHDGDIITESWDDAGCDGTPDAYCSSMSRD